MDLAECIRSDRATREFTDRPVPKATVAELVGLARHAGSGHNRQPWTFVGLRDDRRLETLASFGAYTSPLRRAPVGLVVVADDRDGRRRREHDAFDCGRIAQNLMLAATARGLGTVPQAFRDREGVADLLELPDGKRPVVGIALGHPAPDPDGTVEGVGKAEELDSLGRRATGELLHWERHP